MNNINMTMVEGFLVKKPSFQRLKNNSSLCKFTIGSSRTYKKKDGEIVRESTFVDITTWAKLADVCEKFLEKGSRVMVTGTLKKSIWRDENDNTCSRMYIEAREVHFLPSRKLLQTSKYAKPYGSNSEAVGEYALA